MKRGSFDAGRKIKFWDDAAGTVPAVVKDLSNNVLVQPVKVPADGHLDVRFDQWPVYYSDNARGWRRINRVPGGAPDVGIEGVTADAAEINKLDGLLTTRAELSLLDGCKLFVASSFVGAYSDHIEVADVNSGTYGSCIVPAGAIFRIVDIKMCARGGAASGATHVNVKMGAKVIMSVPVANLVQDKWVHLTDTNVVTTDFNTNGADGEDIVVDKTGASALATSTYIDIVVLYSTSEV